MRYIADIHIHSRFSRATSKDLVPEELHRWALLKGIDVVGTGDCVHPGWLEELEEKLLPAENGLLRLKDAPRKENISFLLTTEISSIYKRGGKVRKVHNLCVFPDFATARKVQARLERIGNIRADGRPILGLDSRDLLGIVLESDPRSYLIPAHIWTPWFSLLGSMSGFDSVEECFGDLTKEVFAVETGLSSDPPMNRACSFLDRFTLVSNSDAHSPANLGREANLFETELSYEGMLAALRTGRGFGGTIEFFPQEGKYHFDGHRDCGVRWDPLETLRHNGICSSCGKPVTRGVMYRVAELADRKDPASAARAPFRSITPLPELLAEILGVASPNAKKVRNEYFRLTAGLGPEFDILLSRDLDEIRGVGGELLAEGIRRLRKGEVHAEAGYDGEFGRVKVFEKSELQGVAKGHRLSGDRPAGSSIDKAAERLR